MRILKCNVCGRDIGFDNQSDVQSICCTLGYWSKYDGETIVLDICPECLDEIIESCVIDPRLSELK